MIPGKKNNNTQEQIPTGQEKKIIIHKNKSLQDRKKVRWGLSAYLV